MHEALWTDHRFRTFLLAMRGGLFGVGVEDDERDAFLEQARRRIVPIVQRRVLAEVGATVDDQGVAVVAYELLEESAWDRRRTWLIASSDPWGFLADLVVRELKAAYGETSGVRGEDGDEAELAGILAASTRRGIEGGSGGDGTA
ncbi:hypothetical protein [Microbacterium sp. CPCC 204701]|uniref:hypothetical protein n=1 Tax=Microbacterium sp. CPCC 204701 TaxID=2493084 RepID=UPI000FDA7630|nr:hypothetical protein [Microbacterium sp. CPCC 204701]